MINKNSNLIGKRMQADANLLKDGLQLDVQDKVVSFIHSQQKEKNNSETIFSGWDGLRQWMLPVGLVATLVLMLGLNFVNINEEAQENSLKQMAQVVELNNDSDKLVASNGDLVEQEKQGLKNDLTYLSRIFTL